MAEAEACPVAEATSEGSLEVTNNFELEYEFGMTVPGPLTLKKFRSKRSGMSAYFVDMDTQVINGYFCFGTDQPEAIGIEQLLHQLDSSGGLLPRAMRGDMLRPAWQFHGAENPLADRDESCYVCCALGESAFLGTFSCSLYLLQNLEAVLELHGYPYPYVEKDLTKTVPGEVKPTGEGEGPGLGEGLHAPQGEEKETEDEKDEPDVAPILESPFYCLSEAGEGAMAWEATLQSMFPGIKAFWNRLLSDGRTQRLGEKMRKCFDAMYRPENMSVIITGALQNLDHILEMLSDHEQDFYDSHPNLPAFSRPWTTPMPPIPAAESHVVRFISRNPFKLPFATVCIGWRGCPSTDLETSMALKVLTAHIAVGPLWSKLVSEGLSHRISWCQLEYMETCSLITVHGVIGLENAQKIVEITDTTLKELVSGDVNANTGLNMNEVRQMADRMGWHYLRETESDPFLVIASAVAKAERYGAGTKEQIENRLCPRAIVTDMMVKPDKYWMDLFQTYFIKNPFYSTRVVPLDETEEKNLRQEEEQKIVQERPVSEMQYAEGSRRAASKPRRKSGNAVGEESNVAVDEDGRNNNNILPPLTEGKPEESLSAHAIVEYEGPLEEQLKENPFPFGDHDDELENFEQRMEVTKKFLTSVRESEMRYWNVTSFKTGQEKQHPMFPLTDMPIPTFLDDTESAFVYITIGLDTTHLCNATRRLLAPVTAALGAFVCPRPPALDTDSEIPTPSEFNPPLHIRDSQVSLGLNGESTQNIFLTIIVSPNKYSWAVGLLHHILNDATFSTNYLRFIAKEAVRGLAANYKMQRPDEPNYEVFDSGEINLHGLISLIYKEESNARLFVGRRRLDLMLEFLEQLDKNPEQVTKDTNETWRKIVNGNNLILQIAGNIESIAKVHGDLREPWKKYFGAAKTPLPTVQLTAEPQVMLPPTGEGIVVELSEPRTPCLSLAIPINPNSPDFPKLCMAAQMFSMAQKWTWSCWGLDDVCSPVLRMPCSYANLITLNLECLDVMGCLMAMQMMMKPDWPWLETLLSATKLMVINDPATLEIGAQGSIMSALLSHINGQTVENRRSLLKESMNVTLEDIKEVISKHLVNLFNPSTAWCSLMVYKPHSEALISRIEERGYKLKSIPINELCKTI